MSFTLTEHSNQHGNFSTNIYKSWTHYVQLAFFLPANKHPTFYEDVSDIRYQRLQNLLCLPKVVYAEFETAIHNAVTTVWPGLEVKACRLHLGQSWWRKIQSWDSASSTERKEERKKVSWFLMKIFRLSLLLPAEVCDCFALECLSNLPKDKRVEAFCDYLLENYIDADSTFPLLVW